MPQLEVLPPFVVTLRILHGARKVRVVLAGQGPSGTPGGERQFFQCFWVAASRSGSLGARSSASKGIEEATSLSREIGMSDLDQIG